VKKPMPTFRDLAEAECHALLNRHHVGRLALSHKDRVEIVPIHYVHDEGWIYGRTAAGSKLEIAAHNRWVAFEVDEVDGLFDWRSVVGKGGLYILRKDGSEQEQALYDKGLKMIRRLVPEALTPNDPVPDRALLFRIHLDELTGREASTRG
jgi:nitroimidazol reductase NimA-like FMN-containing flavoprotein (pyridoxamine 5'-phosphate oxidase superfamily)